MRWVGSIEGICNEQVALNVIRSEPITNRLYGVSIGMKTFYQRNLPHIQPVHGIFFVTFRLANSLSASIMQRLRENHEVKCKEIERTAQGVKRDEELYKEQKHYFALFDKYLESSENGVCWLKRAEIAGIVSEAMHFRDKKEYELIAYCIMPNHVHLVICCNEDYNAGALCSDNQSELLSRQLYHILQSLKRFTAQECNKKLGRTGTFWQKESYDHLVRNPKELQNIISYTLQNPVKAGLVENWEDWRFSYVNENYL